MSDLKRIHALIARTRRRLRLQAAFEWGTTALIPAVALSLVVLWLWRMEHLSGQAAATLALSLLFAVGVCAILGAARRIPAHLVATRLDRSSGLASRLGTACDFADRLSAGAGDEPEETRALMELAIADGLRAAERASPKAAAPYLAPRDGAAALVFVGIGILMLLLAFSPERTMGLPRADRDADRNRVDDRLGQALADEDVEYSLDIIEEMKKLAEESGDQELGELAQKLEELLEKADRGEISKKELLAEMAKLEQSYQEGAEADLEATLKDLEDTGKELKKEDLTRRLGEALEAGDLEAAQKEMERLAEKMDKGELDEKQQEKLAEKLEEVARKFEEKEKKEQQQAQQKIDQMKQRMQRLQKRVAENPQNEDMKRRLQKQKRELERLEREQKERKESAQKRKLQQLHRNMKETAENLRNKKPQAQRRMRDAARDMRDIQDEIRKVQNQQRTRSQLADLKEALRRAKADKGDKGNQGRQRRLQDFQRRAAGQKGNRQTWRPGQGPKPGERGQGKEGLTPNRGQKQGQGNQPGDGIGDESDPNLMGDPSDRYGDTRDEKVSGVHGQGPSRKETIITAAKKGFANTSYKKVFTDYQKIVEEVMSQEKVPQGYKYYVKRYFQRIKPNE